MAIPRPQYSTGDLVFTAEDWHGQGEPIPGTGWGIVYDIFYVVPLGDDRFLIVFYYDESEVNPDQTVYEFGQVLTITGETYTLGPRFDFFDVNVRHGMIQVGPNRIMYAKPDRYLRPGGNPQSGADYYEQVTLTLMDIGPASYTVVDQLVFTTRETQRNMPWGEVEIYPGPDASTFIVYLRATFADLWALRRIHVNGDSITIDPEIVTTGPILKAGHPVGNLLVFTPHQARSSTTPIILRVFDGAQMAWVGEIELPVLQTNTDAVALDDHTLFMASSEDYDEAAIFTIDISSGTVTEHDNSKWPVRLDAAGWKEEDTGFSTNTPFFDPRRPSATAREKSFIASGLQLHLLSPGIVAGISTLAWSGWDDNEKLVWFWNVEEQEVVGWGIVKPDLGYDLPDQIRGLDVSEAHPLLAKHHEQVYSGGLLISLTHNRYPSDFEWTEGSTWLTMASLPPPKVEGAQKSMRTRFWQ